MLLFLLLLMVPDSVTTYRPDFVIVADEVHPFDGEVTRSIYCFKYYPSEEYGVECKLVGIWASTPENIKVIENTVVWGKQEVKARKMVRYRGPPQPMREYVEMFEPIECLWFGIHWWCECD